MGEAIESGAAADGTSVPPPAAAECAELRAALAQAEENLRQQREQYLRAAAELDNVRKRAQRDIEAANRHGLEKFAAELLPVKDSLEQAVQTGSRPTPGRCGRASRRRCSC